MAYSCGLAAHYCKMRWRMRRGRDRKLRRVVTLASKARRVKCDEAKPWCKRCIKFGVDCDGYPAPKGHPRTAKHLRPRVQAAGSIVPSAGRTVIYSMEPVRLFEDEQEGRCFRIYCDEMAYQLKGPFKTSLWSQLIPQVSHAEPFIRHAIIALGAMRKITHGPDNAGEGFQLSPANAPDFFYALRQYEKALQGMRQTIADGRKDIQKALIACILVFCFETLTNKMNNAVVNAESGLLLLHSWMRENLPNHVGCNPSKEWQDHRIEEDLMIAFSTLDLQVLFFRDGRPARTHEYVINSADGSIAQMPAEFGTLKAAHNFWMLIMRRNYHFIVMVLGQGKASEMCGPLMHGDAPYEDCVNIFPGGNIFSTPKEPPFELFPACMRYCDDVARWTKASAQVFRDMETTGTEEERVLIALLKIHSIMGPIMLTSAFFTTQTAYDQYLSEFRKIITLCEWVLPRLMGPAGGKAVYHFDLGVLVGLFLVGAKCRDLTLRNRAIDLLFGYRLREGFWDSAAAGLFIVWARDLDEEGRDENGEIPEEKRWFITSAYVDMDKQKCLVSATRKELDGLEFRHKEIFW
ncbi:hypothetical protein ONS95_006886 [Cadophora gregata]|uniref:uncharacterized protein n=1 Tax=Cadophora gregata TaxID=51156 RepID=UPI0026DCA67B|nr:uncharacterized protein ONS95_006886 [Cadophora gregata]KAK0101731.1 hypothetical protein ONS95_006886 [Cadophora gregata]